MQSEVRRVLLVSFTTGHFNELIRVAEALSKSGRYQPILFFHNRYAGIELQQAICDRIGIPNQIVDLATKYDKIVLPGILRDRDESTENSNGKSADGDVPCQSEIDRTQAFRKYIISLVPPVVRTPAVERWRLLYKKYWEFRLRLRNALDRRGIGTIVVLCWISLIVFRRATNGVFSVDPKGSTPLGRAVLELISELYARRPQSLSGLFRLSALQQEKIPEFLTRSNIKFLVIAENNLFLGTHLFVDAARKANARSIIVPFTIANETEWAENFFSRPEAQVNGIINRLLARAFPNWVKFHNGRELIIPANYLLLHEWLGLTPQRPWLINSGHADVLAAESPFMERYYADAGIPPTQIALTGALSDDELYSRMQQAERHREDLYLELGLPSGRQMILCALPPNQLRGDGRSACDFNRYDALVRFWMVELCSNKKFNVIVSLHPRAQDSDIGCLVDFPVKVSRRRISELVPLCTLFVASASATIRMAMATGRPTLNYDVYRYNYSDYQGVEGVITVAEKDMFSKVLYRLLNDPIYFSRMESTLAASSKRDALLDGKAWKRMLELFDQSEFSEPNSD